MDLATIIGSLAAFCTTVSYFPQLKKCWETGHTGDLSVKMLSILAIGLATWVIYGFLRNDYVVIASNVVSLGLLSGILYFKMKELKRGPASHQPVPSRTIRRGKMFLCLL
jgi:MtN3 and saliva related transmembrane protein